VLSTNLRSGHAQSMGRKPIDRTLGVCFLFGYFFFAQAKKK